MTALKPSVTHNVVGVKAGRYPSNTTCSHPECNEPATDNHHVWPRSFITNSLWFVSIDGADPIPHVTGLCHTHHMDVEDHRAWIKYEDGEFVWYDRGLTVGVERSSAVGDENGDLWQKLGPLNPQPGSREGKPKRRKFKGEARKQRKTVSIRVPDDASEDGAGLLDEAVEALETKISGDKPRPKYFTIIDAVNYTLLNASEDDFA